MDKLFHSKIELKDSSLCEKKKKMKIDQELINKITDSIVTIDDLNNNQINYSTNNLDHKSTCSSIASTFDTKSTNKKCSTVTSPIEIKTIKTSFINSPKRTNKKTNKRKYDQVEDYARIEEDINRLLNSRFDRAKEVNSLLNDCYERIVVDNFDSLNGNHNNSISSENLDYHQSNCSDNDYLDKQKSQGLEFSESVEYIDSYGINHDLLFKDNLCNEEEIKAEVEQSVLIKDLDKLLESLSQNNNSNEISQDDVWDVARKEEKQIDEPIGNDNLDKENRPENDLNKQSLVEFNEERKLIDFKPEDTDEPNLIQSDLFTDFNDLSEHDPIQPNLFTDLNEINSIQPKTDELKDHDKLNLADQDYSFEYPTDEIKDLDEIENKSNECPFNQSLFNDLALSSDDEDMEIKHSFKEKLKIDKSDLKDFYKIEKILSKRLKSNGKLEYLVKYENLDDDQLMWERERNLDSKMVKEFNDKYGDKLLVRDISKATKLEYFDTCIGDETSNNAPSLELDELIQQSVDKPLCDVYNNIKPEQIIGIYEHKNKKYFLVKWEKLVKADLYECSKFKKRFPNTVFDYYVNRMMFCDLEDKLQSEPLKRNYRVDLN